MVKQEAGGPLCGKPAILQFTEKRCAAPIWNLDDFLGLVTQEVRRGSPDGPIVFSIVEVMQEEVLRSLFEQILQ